MGMALVAPLIALAHIGDHRLGILCLGLQGSDESILGLDGEGVRTSVAAKSHGVFGRHLTPSRSECSSSRSIYQAPVFAMLFHGSLGSCALPFWSSSTEMPSGERTKAMWPSRGGRLMVTPASARRLQVAYISSTAKARWPKLRPPG